MLFLTNSTRGIYFEVFALLTFSTALLIRSAQGSNETTSSTSSMEIGQKTSKALFSSALGYKALCHRLLQISIEHQVGSHSPAMQLPVFCVPYLYFRKEKESSCECSMEKLDETLNPETPMPPTLDVNGICLAYKCPHLQTTRECTCVAHNVIVSNPNSSDGPTPVLQSTWIEKRFCRCTFKCFPPLKSEKPGLHLPPMHPSKNCVFALEITNTNGVINPNNDVQAQFTNLDAVKCDCGWKNMDQAICNCYERK